MKKFFLAMAIALVLSVQSLCSAVTISESTFRGNAEMIYPVVHLANAEIEKKINTKIEIEMGSFIKGLRYAAQYHGKTVTGARTRYEVGCNEDGNTVILSIILTKSYMCKDAAHPITYKMPMNFNLSTGTLIGIDYLTDIGEGVSVDELRGRVERALVKHCKRKGITLFDDALPLKNLPNDFYWDKKLHVHFIFSTDTVAPYAAGIIDVDIDA